MPVPNRCDFLATFALFTLAGRWSPADEPKSAPDEAITRGFIGVGGIGSSLLDILNGFGDVRVVAIADVDAARVGEAPGGQPETDQDSRKLLDRKDIDAIVVATPDHWHAIATILACRAGKDVYCECEKPLTYTLDEGRRVAEAAAKYKRVTQMGNLVHVPCGFCDRGAGIAIYGTKGTLHGYYNGDTLVPNPGEEIAEPPQTLPRSVGHHCEWPDAIKSRAQCSCHFGSGEQLSALAHLGNIALKTGAKLAWDGAQGRITNHPDASAVLLRDECRKPWVLSEV